VFTTYNPVLAVASARLNDENGRFLGASETEQNQRVRPSRLAHPITPKQALKEDKEHTTSSSEGRKTVVLLVV
jgi:hypothetical protein